MTRAEGIYCALVTPLDAQEDIDLEAAARITRHVVGGGVNGILALGSTGEQLALTRENKKRFLKRVRASMPADMPLMAGCGALSTRLAMENVRDAQDAGADAVMITPPCFYPFGDDELVTYYSQIAKEARVPVYLYNISRYVGVRIGVGAVKRLLDEKRIVGIKESDRDLEYVAQLLDATRERPDFSVIEGSERVFAESFPMGCPAGVTVIGNLAPEIAPALYQAWQARDLEKMKALQQKLLDYWAVLSLFGRYPLELKECMASKGLCDPRMTSPFQPLLQKERDALLQALSALETQYANPRA